MDSFSFSISYRFFLFVVLWHEDVVWRVRFSYDEFDTASLYTVVASPLSVNLTKSVNLLYWGGGGDMSLFEMRIWPFSRGILKKTH